MLIRVNRKVKKALILSLSLAAVIPSIHALSINPHATSSGFGNSSLQCINQQNDKWEKHPDNDGTLCYFCNGQMMKNYWYKNPDSGHVRYLDKNGKMVKDSWLIHPDNDGSTCYVNGRGIMMKDFWLPSPSGGMRYIDENGKMVINRWAYNREKNKHYYLGPDGKTAANGIVPHRDNDGSQCLVDENGIMYRNYWRTIERNTYYFDNEGKMVKNQWVTIINGRRRYLNGDGVLIKNQCIKHPDYENSLCYVNNDGDMSKDNWISHPFYSSVICFVNNNGVASEYLSCTLGENGQITEYPIDNPSLYQNMDLNNIEINQKQDVNAMEEYKPYLSFDLNADSDDERLMELE